jgi:hypothetical protein
VKLRYTITAEYELDENDEDVLHSHGLVAPVDPAEVADAEEELLGNDPVEFLMATDSYPPTYTVEAVQP